jgi:hypothetical protein
MNCTYTQRYVANAAVANRFVNTTELFESKFVLTGLGIGFRILAGVRIKRIQMWCSNNALAGANSISVEWQTNNPAYGTTSRIYSDTAVGVSDVAYVDCRPPSSIFGYDWLPDTSTTPFTVFYLTCPQYTVVDVTMSLTFMDNEQQVPLTYPPIGIGTTGVLYTRALDNGNVAPVFIPQSVNTL